MAFNQQPQQYTHRLANAAAQAAQPFLGYLSGNTYSAESPAGTQSAAAQATSSATTNMEPVAGPSRRRESLDEDTKKKDSKNLDSIVSQFYAKAAQVITQARFTHVPVPSDNSVSREASTSSTGTSSGLANSTGKKSRNRWFNLELEESDVFKEELRTWKSVTTLLNASPSASSSLSGSSSSRAASAAYSSVPSMIIDVILDVSDMSGNQVLVMNDPQGKRSRVDLSGRRNSAHQSSADNSPKRNNIILERWTLSLKPPPSTNAPEIPELPSVYKHCIILFRALYTLVRALPAFELHRKQKRRKGHAELKIGCRLSTSDLGSSSSDQQQSEEGSTEIGLDDSLGEDDPSFAVRDFAFVPIVTPIGSLDLRCRYRHCVDFSVEEIEALLSSRFIDEDFFKPTMRKYSSSTGGGSVPIRGSAGSPTLVAYSQGQQRPRSQIGTPPIPVPPDPRQGAFVTYGRAEGAQALSRLNSSQGTTPPTGASDLTRRPSIGTSHPFKVASSPSAAPLPRQISSTPPQETSLAQRYASSPASLGPSSAFRYSRRASGSSISPGTASPASSSQLTYTKRSIPSPTSTNPPIAGLTAMSLGQSPSSSAVPSPASSSQPIPLPGTTAIPLSSSPTPSLIKRYSSSRYGRSFGRESSGSSPGEVSYWPADNPHRRSRLSSTNSREEGRSSAAPASRQLGTPLTEEPPHVNPSPDADDIRSFLGMIDSRAQLPSSSLLLGGGGAGARSTIFSRTQAEEKLRSMADSVFREGPPSQTTHNPQVSNITASRALGIGQHTRSRSGEYSPVSFPSRHTPSPDMYSASPIEGSGGYLSTSGAPHSLRTRASQAPMSGSIPEEDPHYPNPSQAAAGHSPRIHSSSLGGSGTGGSHFPFPRYVSSSMRRRGSSQSSGSRPSIVPSPRQTSAENSQTMPERKDALRVESGSPFISGRGESSASPTIQTEDHESEEQTMGQLDLGSSVEYHH